MNSRRRLPDWTLYATVFILALVATHVGLLLRSGDVAHFWSAAGIGTVAFVAVDRRRLPGVALAVGLSTLLGILLHGFDFSVAVVFSVAGLVQFGVARLLLRRLWIVRRVGPSFTVLLAMWAGLAAVTAVGATVGSVMLSATTGAAPAWWEWFMAGFVGMFVVVPACAAVLAAGPRALLDDLRWEFTGVVAAAAGVIAVMAVLPESSRFGIFLLPLPVLWSALRFGVRPTAVLLAPLSAAMLVLTDRGVGPFAGSPDAILEVRALVVALTASALVLAVQVSVRKSALGRLAGTLDAVRDALLTVDAYGLVRFAGARTKEVFGLAPDEVVGKPIDVLVEPEPETEPNWWRRATGRETRLTAVRADGTRIPVGVSVGMDTWMPGQTVVACRDISHRVELEEGREQMIGAISHELRGPLTAVTGYVGMLLDGEFGPMPEEAHEVLDQVLSSATGMNGIIGDLLELRSLSHTPEVAEPVDILDLAGKVVDEMRGAAAARNVDLALGGDPVWATVAPSQMERAVRNLVGNAIKYTQDGGSVSVEVSGSSEEARVVVEDDGVGIPPEDLPGLFRPFARASNAARHAPGTGLGLAFVREVAEHHGGQVTVASELGAGSRFVLALPASPGPARATVAGPGRPATD